MQNSQTKKCHQVLQFIQKRIFVEQKSNAYLLCNAHRNKNEKKLENTDENDDFHAVGTLHK